MGKSESQMDIMEKSSKPGKRRWTVAEIGLSVLLLLVSCALAGLVVLYTSAVKGNDSAGTTVEKCGCYSSSGTCLPTLFAHDSKPKLTEEITLKIFAEMILMVLCNCDSHMFLDNLVRKLMFE